MHRADISGTLFERIGEQRFQTNLSSREVARATARTAVISDSGSPAPDLLDMQLSH